MKPFTTLRRTFNGLVLASAGLGAVAAHAHGPYRGHWGYDPWFNSFVMGAAIGGSAVYLSRPYPVYPSPAVVISQPPVVVVNSPPVYGSYSTTYTTISPPIPVSEAYYCREAAQYYPVVQTCPSTWVLVRTP